MPRVEPDTVAADLADLVQTAADAEARRQHPRYTERRPAVSGWSAAEHAWHHDALTRLVLRLLDRFAAGKGSTEPVPSETERILALPKWRRGRLQAPETLHPPEGGVDLDALADSQARHAAALAALDPAAVAAAETTFPHPVFGPLDAAGWVRALAVHARHHAEIADDVLADADGSPRTSDLA